MQPFFLIFSYSYNTSVNTGIKIKELLLSKDRKCQKVVYLKYFKLIMSITSRYVGFNEDAEELTNDVFLKVFFKIDKYDPAYPFEVWLKKVTVNTCIDRYRKNERFKDIKIVELKDIDVQESEFKQGTSPELLPLIQELPTQYRLVFNLYIFEDYTHKEIGQMLDISEGTSKSALSRAKKIIKNYLQTNNIRPRSLLNG